MTWSWWVLGNRYGGWQAVYAATAVSARRWLRDLIAESFEGEGLSASAARRAAGTYRVYVIAGGCTEVEAKDAVAAWEADINADLAAALHRRYCRSQGRKPFMNLNGDIDGRAAS